MTTGNRQAGFLAENRQPTGPQRNTSPVSNGFGFGDSILSTGFFSTTDLVALSALFGALQDGSLGFQVNDTSPYDNFYDFTQGVDGGLIDVGTGPVVDPPAEAP